jgi:long-chain acyl-CoA synthetase
MGMVAGDTLPELFRNRVALTPRGEAYRHFDRLSGSWKSHTWSDIERRVARWRRALAREALAPGSRIAILVPNGVEHLCMDQAALALGFVPVPLHVVDNPESIVYILSDTAAAILLIDSARTWSALAGLRSRFPELRRVLWLARPEPGLGPQSGGVCADDWLDAADGDAEPAPAVVTPDALAAIVYTSGTTGRPKGVMLTHRNVVSNVRALLAIVEVRESDVFLSFLPLSHTFERTVGYYLPIAAGACVAYARSVHDLAEDLVTVRPTILISVPRIYERFYAKIQESLAAAGPLGRRLFAWTEAIGWRRFAAAQRRGAGPGPIGRLAWPVLERLVANRVLARFGGRVRFAIAGGAPLGERVARCFLSLGLGVLQGYGMTESAPVVSANTLEDNDPLSVGRAIPGVEARIGANAELLVRGPNVMRGYWRRPEDTQRAIEDGWLHTGDQAAIEGGRIYIRGRIKDIIVTSTGEKIAPADLELAIAADPLFAQAMVIGEGRPYLCALLVLDAEHWAREAAALGLDAHDARALESAAAKRLVLARVRKAASGLPAYATPRAAWCTLDAWTVAGGLITPTLKLKRPAIEARFAEQILALYGGHASA